MAPAEQCLPTDPSCDCLRCRAMLCCKLLAQQGACFPAGQCSVRHFWLNKALVFLVFLQGNAVLRTYGSTRHPCSLFSCRAMPATRPHLRLSVLQGNAVLVTSGSTRHLFSAFSCRAMPATRPTLRLSVLHGNAVSETSGSTRRLFSCRAMQC